MKIVRNILFPIALLYGSLVTFHRSLHRWGLLKTAQFKLPIVNIGNLSVGGSGKSPHVEYVHQVLAPKYSPAIVSRGYKRKSRGPKIVTSKSSVEEVGDEPLQFKHKFPSTAVVVAEKRGAGIQLLLQNKSTINCILLDDAFQHWAIQASVHLLLTTFDQPFFEDWVLPAGRLREFRSGYQRADIIIVSKCPPSISEAQKKDYLQRIKPQTHQQVFFSYFSYQNLYALGDMTIKMDLGDLSDKTIFVVTAIANTQYLEEFVNSHCKMANYLRFADHHYFTLADMQQIKAQAAGKLVVTTQKDATRMILHLDYIIKHQLEIYVLPIAVEIAFEEAKLFEEALLTLIESRD